MMKFFLSECFHKRRDASIALLLVLGAMLLTFWPGILMSDTSARWAAVLTIKGVLNVGWSLEQWLAPTMTIFMLPFGSTGQAAALFTAMQVAYLSLAGLMWISLTSSRRPFWVPLLFAVPIVSLYAVYIVPDIWTLAALIVVTAILASGARRLGAVSLLLFFLSSIILFGFRQNSLVLLPFVAFLILKRASEWRWERPVLLALMTTAVFLIATVPQHIGFGARTSSAAAPTWELVGMLRIAHERNIPVDPKVTLEGIADTSSAIKSHSFTTIDSLLWGEGAVVSSGIILHHSDQLKSRWFRAIREYPSLYVLMKINTYKCMLGLCDQLLQTHVPPEEPQPFLEGRVSAYTEKEGFGSVIQDMNAFLAQRLTFLYLPVFWLPVGWFVFAMQWRRYSAFDRLLIGGASIYVLSFFILNQAASFRYMFPAYAIYTAYQIRFMGWLASHLRRAEPDAKVVEREVPASRFTQFAKQRPVRAGLIGLAFLLAISYSLRDKDFDRVTGASNLEASYHALLTMKALKDSPAEDHWFLPTVSLGDKLDKHISWGATVPTKGGDYIYTSFTPPGFLAPYLIFDAFQIEVSERNLARFNFAIGALVTLVLYGLLFKMLLGSGFSRQVAVGGAVAGALISIFSKEVLQSHGIVYWIHSLYQLILVASLYFLFTYLTSGPEQGNKKSKAAVYLLVAVFVGAWTEWTGYIFGIGLAVLLWFGAFGETPQRKLSIKVILALAAAGLVTLLHYGLAVGFESALQAFLARFFARNSSSGSLVGLLSGYALSFGLFLVVSFGIAIISFFSSGNKGGSAAMNGKIAFLFAAATIPLAENLIMMQHAGQFSFDRLKLLLPLAIIVALAFARYSVVLRYVLVVSLAFASIHGYKAYVQDLSNYSAWAQLDQKNQTLATSLSKLTDIKCAVLLSNINVRAYSNLLFDRGIHEYKNKEESSALLGKTQACSAVYLDGVGVFADLPYYRSALVTKPDGSVSALEFLAAESVDGSFFLTDWNWENGVAKRWAGFFVPNTEQVRSQLEKARFVVFKNGDMRRISELKAFDQYLNVYVEGDILKPADVGLPSSYLVLSTPSSPGT